MLLLVPGDKRMVNNVKSSLFLYIYRIYSRSRRPRQYGILSEVKLWKHTFTCFYLIVWLHIVFANDSILVQYVSN